MKGRDEYYQKVMATINLILGIDIKAVVYIDYTDHLEPVLAEILKVQAI